MLFVTETLVTDTVVYEVLDITAKTMTIRSMTRGEQVYHNGEQLPVIGLKGVSDPLGDVKVVRLRKDGTYRTGRGMNPLRATTEPVFMTDYKY